FCQESFSQKYDFKTICYPDTLTIQGSLNIKGMGDSTSFKAVRCEKRTNAGLRVEIGFSKYYYNTATENWLGNHGGPNFNFILTINKFNIGLRFKPWTVNPKSDLTFRNDTLSRLAELNPVKIDYYLGYSIDLKNNISLEPYLGYSRTV